MKYNLGDLQRDLGVFKLLEKMPTIMVTYSDTILNNVKPIIKARDKIETSFWQRPNFGWTLECESKPKTSRAAYLKVLARITSTTQESGNSQDVGGHKYIAVIMAAMATSFACLCGCVVANKLSNNCMLRATEGD